MAVTTNMRRFASETTEGLKRAATLRPNAPTRVETFEAACQRQQLSEQHLLEVFRQRRTMHLAMYALALAGAIYALWLVLNFSILVGFVAFLWSASSAVIGYLQGFRAWQIQHRHLIRLQDALRIPDTYLVL
jgi:hypothetical protein